MKNTIVKTFYITTKSVAAGATLGLTCFRAMKLCLKNVGKENLPSFACRVAVFTCNPFMGAAFLGAVADPTTFKKVTGVVFKGCKIAALAYNAPAKGLDITLACFEEAVFGEPLPLITDPIL